MQSSTAAAATASRARKKHWRRHSARPVSRRSDSGSGARPTRSSSRRSTSGVGADVSRDRPVTSAPLQRAKTFWVRYALPKAAQVPHFEPSNILVLLISALQICGFVMVVLYTINGERCVNSIVQADAPPRSNCARRAFSSEELAAAFGNASVTSYPALTGPVSVRTTFQVYRAGSIPAERRAFLGERIADLCAHNTGANVTARLRGCDSSRGCYNTIHVADEAVFSFAVPVVLEHRCSGSGWSLFTRASAVELNNVELHLVLHGAAVVETYTLDRVDLVSSFFEDFLPRNEVSLERPLDVQQLHCFTQDYAYWTRGLGHVEGVGFVSHDLLLSCSSGQFVRRDGRRTQAANSFEVQLPELNETRAPILALFDAADTFERVYFDLKRDPHAVIRYEAAGIAFTCITSSCWLLWERLSAALATYMGVLGGICFLFRLTRPMHRSPQDDSKKTTSFITSVLSANPWTQPREVAQKLLLATYMFGAFIFAAFVFFGEGACVETLADKLSNPRGNCLERLEFSRAQLATMFPTLDANGGVCSAGQADRCVGQTSSWATQCSSSSSQGQDGPPNAAQSAFFVASFPRFVGYANTTYVTQALCALARSTNATVSIETIADAATSADKSSGGVRVSWRSMVLDAPDANDQLARGNITRACSGDSWIVVEVAADGQGTVAPFTSVLVMSERLSILDTRVEIDPSGLLELWYEWAATSSSAAATVKFGDTSSIVCDGPLTFFGGALDLDFSGGSAGRASIVLDVNLRDAREGTFSCRTRCRAPGCRTLRIGAAGMQVPGVDVSLAPIQLGQVSFVEFLSSFEEFETMAVHFNASTASCVQPSVEFAEGDVALKCVTQLCPTVFERFAQASALFLFLVAVMGFLISTLPCCHRYIDGQHHVPAVVGSLYPGAATVSAAPHLQPKRCTVILVLTTQFVLTILIIAYLASAQRCLTGLGLSATFPVLGRGCVERQLTSAEVERLVGSDVVARVPTRTGTGSSTSAVLTGSCKNSGFVDFLCGMGATTLNASLDRTGAGRLSWSWSSASNATSYVEPFPTTVAMNLDDRVCANDSWLISFSSSSRAFTLVLLDAEPIETGFDAKPVATSALFGSESGTVVFDTSIVSFPIVYLSVNDSGIVNMSAGSLAPHGELGADQTKLWFQTIRAPALASMPSSAATEVDQLTALFYPSPTAELRVEPVQVPLWCPNEQCTTLIENLVFVFALALSFLSVLYSVISDCRCFHEETKRLRPPLDDTTDTKLDHIRLDSMERVNR